jgi:hypothetical protein
VSEVRDHPADRREREQFTPEAADRLAAHLLGDLRSKLCGHHIEPIRRVPERVRSAAEERAVAVALLHEVVEKRQNSLDDLVVVAQDERVMCLVDMLTRRESESVKEHLPRRAADPVALAVKRSNPADKHSPGDALVDWQTARRLSQEEQARLVLLEQLAVQQAEVVSDWLSTMGAPPPVGEKLEPTQ